jgi:hypothetical protein
MQMLWKISSAFLTLVFSVQAYPAPSQADATQPGGAEANRVVAQGCLQRSGWQYFLNERDGTQEQVTGYSKLKEFVGHEIEITGVRGVRTVDNTPPGGASSVITRSVVNVRTVKDLGKGCPGAN